MQKFISNHTLTSKLQSDQVSAMFSKKEKNTSNLTPITVYVKHILFLKVKLYKFLNEEHGFRSKNRAFGRYISFE